MNRYKFLEDKHIHTLDSKSLNGTTTVLNVISKPLTWWASARAVEKLGWVNPKIATTEECLKQAEPYLETIKKMSLLEYVQLLNRAYKAHNERLKDSAIKGVDLHSEVEKYIKNTIQGKIEPFPLEIKPFQLWCEKNVKQFLFSELFVYSEVLWVGGIIDFAYIDSYDQIVLSDTKSGGAYFSGVAQLGGYHIQLEENDGGFDKDGNRIFYLAGRKIVKHAIFSFKNGFKETTLI